jgi:hypothetical protein
VVMRRRSRRRGYLTRGVAVAALVLGAGPAVPGISRSRLVAAPDATAASTPRFDLTAPSSPLIKNKPLTGTRVPQSYAFDNVHQRIYVVQLLPGADSTGDLYLNQLDWTGTLLGHMTLKGFGHGVSIGVEPVGSTPYLWTEVDDDPANGRGRHIARFVYRAGTTLTNTSAALEKFDLVPGASVETVSIDQTYKRIILRYFLSGHAHYATYDLTAFETDHMFTKVYDDVAEPSWMSDPDFQGYVSYGDYLYLFQGTAYGTDNPREGKGNASITSVDLSTGQVVERQVRTQAGYSLYYREPEGMGIQLTGGTPRLCLGFASTATETSTTRLFTVYYKDALV